ncbi:hypothetical protein F7018_11745 [Tenacibaculum aiptasiae]|uniref:Uncharacterized protein n=1 Tax=Tenacibaculum aiptasiae TaxID=426481 RepID=A0A7J5AC91_9FLAO|nr:hypothetical protein [Tenacibaculum aiptasiae]KAB1155145.1 hypothetical protein F7018_11745 [Tenacibaculum aiptasiae]
MKVIHWTPKENINQILEKGILITDTWISCSILTPFKNLNRWWLDFLLNDKEYVGVIFDLEEEDFPLVHSHWCIDTYKEYDDNYEIISQRRYNLKELQIDNPKSVFYNLKELKQDYEKTIIWRIGNTVDNSDYLDKDGIFKSDDKKIIASGLKLIKTNPKKAEKDFFDNPDFMEFVFEDYQVLLFKNIDPNRIEKVIKSNTNYSYHNLMNEIKEHYNSF